LVNILNIIAETYDYPIIVSTHPRTRKMIEKHVVKFNQHVRLMKPMGFCDYNQLQLHANVVLSDSGTISEESSILGFKALNIREAHERPEAMEEVSVMMVGLNSVRVLQGLLELNKPNMNKNDIRQVYDYTVPNVSDKIVKIILSYIDYIRRIVWGETYNSDI